MSSSTTVITTILAISLLIVTAKIFALIFKKIKLPEVIGEILAGVIFVITNTEWNVNSADVTSEQMTATFVETSVLGNIAELLIRSYVLAFEAVSVVLLGAVIGALALVRRR